MFIFNSGSTRSGFEEEDHEREETNHRIAVEISDENIAHVAENKVLKEQNKIDDNVRSEYAKKLFDENSTKAKTTESEKWNKQVEYRQFLLKQIEDKETYKKTNHSPEIRGSAYTYSEDLMTPEVKKNQKLIKQQEMRDALDECIRMKNALKLENKQKELAEDRSRCEFLKKRDDDELIVREKAKQQIEMKEQRNEEAVRQWNTNKDHEREEEREQFIDSLMKKDHQDHEREEEREQFIDSLIEKDHQGHEREEEREQFIDSLMEKDHQDHEREQEREQFIDEEDKLSEEWNANKYETSENPKGTKEETGEKFKENETNEFYHQRFYGRKVHQND